MTEPIHMQDNIQKLPLVQEIADRLSEGAGRSHEAMNKIAQEEQEKATKRNQTTLEEQSDINTLDSDGRKKHQKKSKKKDKKKKDSSYSQEILNDLPLRKEEDDYGKGENLDITG